MSVEDKINIYRAVVETLDGNKQYTGADITKIVEQVYKDYKAEQVTGIKISKENGRVKK